VTAEEPQRTQNGEVRQRRVGVGGGSQRAPDGGRTAKPGDVQRDQLIQPEKFYVRERDHNCEIEKRQNREREGGVPFREFFERVAGSRDRSRKAGKGPGRPYNSYE
jgi:hypothetical protein